jgi:hypothetical protein
MVSLEFANHDKCYQYKMGISRLDKTPTRLMRASEVKANYTRNVGVVGPKLYGDDYRSR